MNDFAILDCTLRDGGYVNNWNFGKKTIQAIIRKLENAKIDIVECGFLTTTDHGDDVSLFNKLEKIEKIVDRKNKDVMLVVMLAIGKDEMHPSKLPVYDGKTIDGIRLTFHQHESDLAVEWAEIIMRKGYKVFMQPVGTALYDDLSLLKLVKVMNNLEPYAFYIVDTLGSMYRNKLLHMFYLIDENLKPGINMGFHPHNNLELAFSNAQELTRIQTKRRVIVDASIYGMGRCAGNLPTELIAQYVNKNISPRYEVSDILDLYDDHISLIREEYEWGYAVAYNIAANYACHPDYALFLINKKTLVMKDIERIIISIPKESRALYNKKIAEQVYMNYQNKKINDERNVEVLTKAIKDKKLLVLAPGKSLLMEYEKIKNFIDKEEPYIISVNFIDDRFAINTCFVSNHKRIDKVKKDLKSADKIDIVATSNIPRDDIIDYLYVDYFSYTNQDDIVFDNAGLMLLKLLEKCGVKKVTLAGFDGFKARFTENYFAEDLNIQVIEYELDEKQVRVSNQLKEMNKNIQIDFLTSSVYEGKHV